MSSPTLAPDPHTHHWDSVYAARDEQALTWHQDVPRPSLDLITARITPGDPVIDVGGGTSRLVDALLDRGFGPVTVLDLSAKALARSRARLGARADAVAWIAADVTRWRPKRRHALWHDRAVFHFLTDDADRAAYLNRLDTALAAHGDVVLSTFAEDGPERCSGLPVARYNPETLSAMIERHLPGKLRLLSSQHHDHITPKGRIQRFQTSVLTRNHS
ncbi:class I SAM-dependent methyltransferase [Rhodobacteraceae bacterium 2376]|uniref:Class I SAM-dependent methyltransferase n=1 Tax=Rhabdonatronobacter sediminivivens TaxID=2743469 RepID=A0A7Z0I102_9RHOB|nr:class I SAM-dependent methyltransferase [Rhabdonatronobacter sediminivivens]NYS25933.1 class I SAM-dependent methyltransferase [Rhabdonatronobacter sediminivivens]